MDFTNKISMIIDREPEKEKIFQQPKISSLVPKEDIRLIEKETCSNNESKVTE